MDVPRRIRRKAATGAPTRWIEPPWKAILSNKGILPLLWEMFPNHPNLLPAYFEDDPQARDARHILRAQAALFARRRQCARWSAAAARSMQQPGPYGAEGFIRQAAAAAAELLRISTRCSGSWLVDHTPCGLSIREDENPITGNTSRFLPHAIL